MSGMTLSSFSGVLSGWETGLTIQSDPRSGPQKNSENELSGLEVISGIAGRGGRLLLSLLEFQQGNNFLNGILKNHRMCKGM